MERILCIVSAMNAGGAETFLMKLYRKMDTEKYQMDFCVGIQNEGFYDKEILEKGGKIFHITPKSQNVIKSFHDIKRIVKEQKYNYVLRVNQHSLATIDLLAAKFGGANNLIMRSSNANSNSKFSSVLHVIFRFLPQNIPTVKIAPSKLSAEYTFGTKAVHNGDVILLHNAIDLNKFEFNQITRNQYRKQFNFEEKFVIGHVGRLSKQKNHHFLLQVFNEVKKDVPEATLVLVGDGELKNSIITQAKKFNIDESVFFLGIRSDVPQLLTAMDVFVFPSLYEGMPNTVIEAQATGLPCVISDTITSEVKLTGLVESLPIDDNAIQLWKNKIVHLHLKNQNRDSKIDELRNLGYDIVTVEEEFEKIIFNG